MNFLQPKIFDQDFRSSNEGIDVSYNLYVFDTRYQKDFTASQPLKVEIEIDGVVLDNINGYDLVITRKLNSVISDGERQFDLF